MWYNILIKNQVRKGLFKMLSTYKNYEELPLFLNANDIANALGIGRVMAYTIMKSKGFPVVLVGKRKIVPKAAFIDWLDAQLNTETAAEAAEA